MHLCILASSFTVKYYRTEVVSMVYSVSCTCIALPFTYTLGGGDVKAYFFIVQPNLVPNLGLLGILGFNILLLRRGINM